MKKEFIKNIVLNLMAIGIPIFVLQIFIYPKLAILFGNDEYGLIITIYSSWVLVGGSLAGALNSTKLVNNEHYKLNKISGDYPILLKKWCLPIAIVCLLIIFYYQTSFNVIHLILGTFVAVLMYLQTYFEIGFKVDINYKNFLFNRIILSVGYVVGYLITIFTGYWEFVFLFGYLLSSIYCKYRSSVFNDKNIKTVKYNQTKTSCNMFALSNIINNTTSYADKLVLYPLIGGEIVTIYYTSTLMSKVTSLVATSLRDIMLSYISKRNKNNKKTFFIVLSIILFICLFLYFIFVFAGKVVIGYLYPQLINEVVIYLPYTTAASMLDVISTIIHPFTIKYCKPKWQVVFSSVTCIVYFVSSLVLWFRYGLLGFCIGTILGQLAKAVVMLIIYIKKSY